MARKNFKTNLGELITGSNIDLNSEKEKSEQNKNIDKLNFIISQLKKELQLWRTGKLTVESFEKSIKEHNLKYDAETNEFSKI